MPFDWFTIVAQIINFAILLWLLRRFLYRPILNGLDARELRLKKILQDANDKDTEAQKRQEHFESKLHELEQQRSLVLEKAQDEALEKRKELFDSAQKAADDMLRKRLISLQSELKNLQHDVLNKNVKEVYAIARKLLTDLAGIELQQAMVEKFIVQLGALQDNQRSTMFSALQASNGLVTVRTAFVLTDEQKDLIKHTLKRLISDKQHPVITLNFSHVPGLIAGLELSIGGWKLVWSIHAYLESLQERVKESLEHQYVSMV